MQQQNINTAKSTNDLYQQPPDMISTKDAMYLTDMLSWNLLALKKAHFYAQQCQDPELKAAFDRCGQMHQRHYEKILTHLNKSKSIS